MAGKAVPHNIVQKRAIPDTANVFVRSLFEVFEKIMFFTFFVIADNGGKINSFDTSENIDVNLRVDFFHFFDKVFNFLTF